MNFAEWRDKARAYLAADLPHWPEGSLFGFEGEVGHLTAKVPRQFLRSAEVVACHSDIQRWSLLYRVLYRLTHGEPYLLEIEVDPDVRLLHSMHKQVAHDIHRMHAFVRFRELDGKYVAWYEPDHDILETTAPWFVQRFGSMTWSILTPRVSAHWDQRNLLFGPGVPRSQAPAVDPQEDLWRAYYESTFNPARLNVRLLRQHMPKRMWNNLPETQVIDSLVREAGSRALTMIETRPRSAADLIPAGAPLAVLRDAIRSCRACDLYECATQPVFGEGPSDARIVCVGEQPGDNEDREGKPFVGPAGQLFDRALADAGMTRGQIYLTGAVKHFRYEQRGKRRIHKTASRAHVAACQPWLQAELALVKPKVIVCMGNTAALSVLGRTVRLLDERGRFNNGVVLTVHPGFLLRIPDEARREQEYRRFVADLALARDYSRIPTEPGVLSG